MFSFDRFEIEGDKANHFVYGALVAALVAICTGSVPLSLAVCAAVAVAKEIWDWRYGSGFDHMDIVWTVAGGLCVVLLEIKKYILMAW